MKIKSVCRGCDKKLAVDAIHAGKKIRCPGCQSVVQLPEADDDLDSRRQVRSPKRPQPSADQPQRQRKSKKKPSSGEKPSARNRSDVKEPQRKRRKSKSSKRRRQKPDPDDIWDEPIGSYGPTIDEEDYEEYGVPPKRKKNSSSSSTSYSDGGYLGSSGGGGAFYGIVLSGCGLAIVLSLVAALVGGQVGVVLAIVAMVIGFLFNTVGSFWILGNAFGDDIVTGFLYLFLPGYALYFLFSRWDENARPFTMSLLGVVVVMAGLVANIMASGGGG